MAEDHELPTDLTTYDFFHDSSDGVNKLNRLCLDLASKRVVYYADISAGLVTVHRGDKSGPIIATSPYSQEKYSTTEIELVELGASVPVQYKRPSFRFSQGSTNFELEGKRYSWRKHTKLIEEETGTVLAVFHPLRSSAHVGSIYITAAGERRKELGIITALVILVR